MPYSSYRPEYIGTSTNQFQARGQQQHVLHNRLPFDTRPRGSVSSESTSPSSSIVSTPSNSDRSVQSMRPQAGYSELTCLPGEQPTAGSAGEFISVPRALASPFMSQVETRTDALSMPPPRRLQPRAPGKGECMACPKCNKEFNATENDALVKHMDSCNEKFSL